MVAGGSNAMRKRIGEDDFRHLAKIPQRPFDALGGIWPPVFLSADFFRAP